MKTIVVSPFGIPTAYVQNQRRPDWEDNSTTLQTLIYSVENARLTYLQARTTMQARSAYGFTFEQMTGSLFPHDDEARAKVRVRNDLFKIGMRLQIDDLLNYQDGKYWLGLGFELQYAGQQMEEKLFWLEQTLEQTKPEDRLSILDVTLALYAGHFMQEYAEPWIVERRRHYVGVKIKLLMIKSLTYAQRNSLEIAYDAMNSALNLNQDFDVRLDEYIDKYRQRLPSFY